MANVKAMRRRWQTHVRNLACGRARLTERRWRNLLVALAKDIAALQELPLRIGEDPLPGGLDPREALVWAWCVLEAMPGGQDQQYMRLKESAVDGSGIEDEVGLVRQREYAMGAMPTAIDEQVPWLAVLARVLDDDLSSLEYWPEDVRTWQADDWRPPGYDVWVVPVERGFRLGDGRSARRRGLRYHAVIPCRLGALCVDLVLHPNATRRDPDTETPDWTYGAAVLPGLTVEPSTSDGRFHVVSADCPDETGVLKEQVSSAAFADCDVVVWPELTMPAERLAALRETLGDDMLGRPHIPLVVAGSWHEPAKGPAGRRNRTRVLLNDGSELMKYDKRRIFPWDGLHEDIDAGDRLPVIVMEDRLVGIEICRDHCDDLETENYALLPVDVILVPSMGGIETLDAHRRHSKTQRSRYGTTSFVVQQEAVSAVETPGAMYSTLLPECKGAAPAVQQGSFRTLP